ncbi:MAG: TonB-dependent receptor, partial [Alistipes sp.]|nr:TonB-dependent receptor [Alistipes sp.]
EGEDYGYHYDLHRSAIGGWARVALQNRHNPRFGGYVGVEVQQIALYRQGAYEKELFPGALSCGASPTLRFTDYTLKSGVSYLFTPNHALRLDVLYGDKAPEAEELFLNPEYCNQTLDHPTPAHRFGAELCYRLSGRRVRAELRGYYTSSVNECEVMRYYDDLSSLYADLILRDLRKRYLGVELGVEVRLSECFALRMAAAQRFDRYSRAPQVTILSDKDHQVIAAQTTTLLQGFALGGSPQRVAVGELFFRHPRLWSASVSINYAGDYPLSPSPLRRMRLVYDYATSPEDRAALTRQEYLPEAVTVDLFVMKSFRMGTHYLSLSASVRNLFNRRRNVYSGYETLRVRKSGTGLNQSVTAFPSKYLYAYPRTYYLSLFFRF